MFTVETIENIKWSDPNHTHILCDVKFYELPYLFKSYGMYVNDNATHVKDIVEKVNSGEYEIDPTPIFNTQEEWIAFITPSLPEPVDDVVSQIP